MLFYFDTRDGERDFIDRTGTDLAAEADAVAQAVDLLRDLSHAPVALGTARVFSVQVRDAVGESLYAASLQLKVDRLR